MEKRFKTLKEAIDSWYLCKVSPSVTVTLLDGSRMSGDLFDSTPDALKVNDADSHAVHSIAAADIEQVELRWCGEDLPGMGELDGTGMEGVRIPIAHWRHRISRCIDSQWVVQEISKERGAS